MLFYFFKNNIGSQGYISLLALSLLTSFATTTFFVKQIVNYFSRFKIYQPINQYLIHHQSTKSNIPTMGGIAIILGILINIILFCSLTNPNVQIILSVIILFGIIGILDDLKKIQRNNNIGHKAKQKFILQIIFALFICFLTQKLVNAQSTFFTLPFIKFNINVYTFFYYIACIFIICGSSNAVNLTDGLDGLAASMLLVTFSSLTIICFLASDKTLSNLFNLNYITQIKDLVLICLTVIGSLLGFLWYNSAPASIFMGDCGSLSLGALMGTISILIKQELLCAIINTFFIIETLSVIIQVIYFNLTNGKRILKMAPFHHHLEEIGVPENKIVSRTTIFSFIISITTILITIST